MKKMIIGAALAALLGTPALAQSYNPTYGTGNTIPEPQYLATSPNSSGFNSFAQAPVERSQRHHNKVRRYDLDR